MQTATNPETKQRYYLDPATNEWVEMQTASVPETGQKYGLINNQWVEIEKGRAQEEAEKMTAFMERVPQAVERGIEEYEERTQALKIGGYEPSVSQKITTAVATAGLTAGDIITDFAITSLPNSVKQGFENLFSGVKDTEAFKLASQAAEKGFEFYETFKENNPAAAATFENVIDVSVLFSPRPDISVLETPARKARAKSSKLNIEKRRKGINQLIAPEELKPNQATEKQGIFGVETWIPDEEASTIVGVLETIPDVDPNASYHHNMRVVQKHIATEAKKLRQFIVKSGNPRIRKNDLALEMGQALEDFKQSSAFRGITPDAQTIVANLAQDAMTLVGRSGTKNTITAMDLLEVRQKFDNMLNESYSGVLEPTSASARTKAARVVRNMLNEKLKQVTPGDEAHHLLNQQHNGYLALDRMNNKRNKEANTTLGILARRLKDAALLPSTLGSLYFTGKTFVEGAGGVAAVTTGAVTGVSIYGLIKGLSKANRVGLYADTLSAVNKLIRNTKESDKLFELKAHRLVLLDLLRGEQESEEDE